MSSDSLNLVLALVSLGLSLVLAIFGVWLQLFSYKAASQQARESVKEVSELRAQMGDMLGRIEGATKTMSEAQQTQFQSMLTAFVGAPRALESAASKSEQSEDEIGLLKAGLSDLAEKLEASAEDPSLKGDIENLRSQMSSISNSVSSLNRELRSVQSTTLGEHNDRP